MWKRKKKKKKRIKNKLRTRIHLQGFSFLEHVEVIEQVGYFHPCFNFLRVLLTDESKFNLLKSDDRWYVCSEEFCHENFRKLVKHEDSLANMYVGNLHFIEGLLDQIFYLETLKTTLRESLCRLGGADNFKFYQGNNCKHTFLIVKFWHLQDFQKILKILLN